MKSVYVILPNKVNANKYEFVVKLYFTNFEEIGHDYILYQNMSGYPVTTRPILKPSCDVFIDELVANVELDRRNKILDLDIPFDYESFKIALNIDGMYEDISFLDFMQNNFSDYESSIKAFRYKGETVKLYRREPNITISGKITLDHQKFYRTNHITTQMLCIAAKVKFTYFTTKKFKLSFLLYLIFVANKIGLNPSIDDFIGM